MALNNKIGKKSIKIIINITWNKVQLFGFTEGILWIGNSFSHVFFRRGPINSVTFIKVDVLMVWVFMTMEDVISNCLPIGYVPLYI